METLNELRKELKKIGFNIKTKTYSEFISATFIHIESKQELSFNCGDSSSWDLWKPLAVFCQEHKNDLLQIKNNEKITGLTKLI
jgi:hypothetical protein